ncbi:uncharacterized protein ISCGN_016721 [Ixodes scapularis]
MVLTPPPPPPLPPLPPQPVPAEVAAADGGSVETTDEHEDRPVSSKRAALDPERPAPEPSGGRYERLKKRVESIERSLDERFARQTEQINEMFSEVNNSVAQLAEQLTQALATLTARMDDVEVRLPPGTGRPIRATGKPRKRGNIQQFVRSREKKPYVILLQETNAPVQLAGYKAAAGTSEGQRKRRGRAVAAGRRGRRAPLSSPAPPPPPPPAAAVLVRRNVTVAQRELQGVKVPHVFVELIPRSGQGWFVLNVYSKPSLQHRFGELFRRARAVAGDGPLLIAGDFNAPHAAWGYGRETPKGKRLWEDSQDQGLEFIVNPADPTRRGNSASAPGPDGVTNKTLRNLDNESIARFTAYVNDCWREGSLPDAWKRARVVMIHKPGKQVTIDNLRPISLTSCVGKVNERAVLTRVTDYLEDSDVFSHTMLGFRRNLSTQDVMLQLKHQIVDDTSSSTKAILGLDLKKAFDNVEHAAILDRVRSLGLSLRTYKYGSVVSPMLFNLVLLGLPAKLAAIEGLHHSLYADITLWVPGGLCDGHIETTLQAGVDAVQEYLRRTGLECSAANSELLLYRPTSRGLQTLLPEGGVRSEIRV